MPDDFRIIGYGKTPMAARDDAETRLPYPLKDFARYRSVVQDDPTREEDGMYKITVTYSLRGSPKATAANSPGSRRSPRPRISTRGAGTVEQAEVSLLRKLPR